MSSMINAREEILSRIRAALSNVPRDEQPEAVPVERTYRRSGESLETNREVLIERFIERVAEYKVTLRRVEEPELPAAIAATCNVRGARRLVVPADVPENWLPGALELLRDEPPLSNEQLDTSDGVLTGCALGIAQTGTIVLDGSARQGRRVLSLLPDYHLCVIFEEQIVDLVPEAITRLSDAVRQHQRPITFISGPSATSDIELNRVEGVHGPRTLEVLVVRARSAPVEW
jgi:L-lactate dehydrogenase complex protein LldG